MAWLPEANGHGEPERLSEQDPSLNVMIEAVRALRKAGPLQCSVRIVVADLVIIVK
jgi:hypothetical protein